MGRNGRIRFQDFEKSKFPPMPLYHSGQRRRFDADLSEFVEEYRS